jgi:ABC-2 type transport system permease protein
MNMTTMLALLHRDLRVARRELKSFALRVGLQPLLYTFIFGYVMPRQGIMAREYGDLLLPGILAMSMTMSGMQAVALPLVIEFGWTKEIEDRLLAPISIGGVALEKILVGLIQSVIAGVIVLPLTWLLIGRGAHLQPQLWLLITIALLVSWLFAAFGMCIGTFAEPQQVGLIFQLILAPMLFFGCTYYPWARLNVLPWFQGMVLVNPLVYASEGFRAALTPQVPHLSLPFIFAGLIGFAALFTYLGLRQFNKRALD